MENIPKNFLQNPDKIDFARLKDMLEKYPWLSLLHIVWLLKCKKERPSEFDRELKEHIIYIHDRKRLFQILHNDIWNELTEKKPLDREDIKIEVSSEASGEEKELLNFSYDGGEEESADDKDPGEYLKNPENNTEFTRWIDKKKKKNSNKDHLIDRFLEIDPGPIPADKKSRLEGDVSRKSVEESENFITDTLAKIYLKQGLYSKAIFAYEKLSLKYPEKSVYFATQIEEIKNLLSNK